jgi:hypothetical protein
MRDEEFPASLGILITCISSPLPRHPHFVTGLGAQDADEVMPPRLVASGIVVLTNNQLVGIVWIQTVTLGVQCRFRPAVEIQ